MSLSIIPYLRYLKSLMIFSLYHLLEFEEFANWSSWGSISLNFLLYFRYMFMIIILSTQAGSIWYLPQHALTGPCHFGLTVKKCGSETSSSLEDAKGWEKQSGFFLIRKIPMFASQMAGVSSWALRRNQRDS